MTDIVARSSQMFVIALQLAAPVMAVSFIVSLVFSVLGRAVPQMNVFHESFTIRTLAGLSVFGVTLQLMAAAHRQLRAAIAGGCPQRGPNARSSLNRNLKFHERIFRG